MAAPAPANNADAAAAAAVDPAPGDTVPAAQHDDDAQTEEEQEELMHAELELLRNELLANGAVPLTMEQLGALHQTGDASQVPLRQFAAPLAVIAAVALAFWPTPCKVVWLIAVHYALATLTIGTLAADKAHIRLATGEHFATAVLVPHAVLLACILWCAGVPSQLFYGQWPVVSLLSTLQLPTGVDTSQWQLLDVITLCFYADWCAKCMSMCAKTAATLCVHAVRRLWTDADRRPAVSYMRLHAAQWCICELFGIYRDMLTAAVWLNYAGGMDNVLLLCAVVALYMLYKLGNIEVHARDAVHCAGLAVNLPHHSPAQADGAVTCPICMGPIQLAVRLPCGHHFCEECVGHLLVHTHHCPNCRANVLHADESFLAYMPPATYSKRVLIL